MERPEVLHGLTLRAASERNHTTQRRVYKMGEVLGRGGQAVVLAAEDVQEERSVAMKVITNDPTHLKDEIGILETMRHPNIIPVFDYGSIERQISDLKDRYLYIPESEYMTMMRANSGSIADLEQRHGSLLPVSQIVSIADQVMAGVDFAHANRVVHNDIKKANVLLHRHGTTEDNRLVQDPYLTAVVTDFGIARVNREPGLLTRMLRTKGTWSHLPPERAFGTDTIAGDVYSTGVMLYELLTGVLPYDNSGTYVKWLTDMEDGNARVRDPNSIPGLDMTLDRKAVLSVALKAISLDPANRYRDMKAMRVALHAQYREAIRHLYGQEPLYISRSAIRQDGENTFEVVIPVPSKRAEKAVVEGRPGRHRQPTSVPAAVPQRYLRQEVRNRMPGEPPSPHPRLVEVHTDDKPGRHRFQTNV